MLLHNDRMGNRQSLSRAFPHFFRGEERIEDPEESEGQGLISAFEDDQRWKKWLTNR
jgi:hypothetical protein